MSTPVTFDDLKRLSGYTEGRVSDVVRFCKRNGIAVFYGKDGKPSTTMQALNVALGVEKDGKSGDEIAF